MPIRRIRAIPLLFILLTSITFSLFLLTAASTVKGATLYDSGSPTADEQLVLEYINRARADPITEGQRLGIDIREGLSNPSYVDPRPPLAMNPILLDIAEAHSQNMYSQNYFSHTDPNGQTPFDRMTNAGYNYVRAGENMAAGTSTPATELEDLMMIDSGNPGRPHRVNLLDLINPYPCDYAPCVYYEVGIGYYAGTVPNSIAADFITEDFGATGSGPFLLGVVYNDRNQNNFYDVGEGIAGVTITTSSGGYYAVSSSSGGYAIPIGTSGTITVTASGSGFGPITKTVTLTGVNVKVDFTTSAQTSATTASTTSETTASTKTSTLIVNSPSVALTPSSTAAGLLVYVSGSGFLAGDIGCSFSGTPVGASTCSISNGMLTGSFLVAGVGRGSYLITAIGSPGGDSASATLIVTGPTIKLNPSSTSAGTTVTVSGSGFSPSDTSCTLSGSSVASYACAISGGILAGSFVASTATGGTYMVTAEGSPAGDSTTATFQLSTTTPTITLNPPSGQAGITVSVSGSGFAPTDSTCTIEGSGSISSSFCSISSGTVTSSFVVASARPATYAIKVTGMQSGDSASAAFTVNPSLTQIATITQTTSSMTLSSTSSMTIAPQQTTVVSTLSTVTSALTGTPSTNRTTSPAASSTLASVPEAMPPLPGFPVESIVIGMVLGMMALWAAGRRSVHRGMGFPCEERDTEVTERQSS
jgi:hypothetical protein